MEFRIADTFTDSLAKLSGDEQKAAKTTAFDLQLDPSNRGMQFHRVDRSKDPNFWSVRVNRDLRAIVHKTNASFMLCYVDRHDKAYAWAERRKIERHPKTGAAQLVEVRETVREIAIPKYVEKEGPKTAPKPLFAGISDDQFLTYGVPAEWLADARAATEDSIFELTDHLPQEAAEALLELATGTTPTPPAPVQPETDAFAHPDAQRRFRIMADSDELERALEYPWEKWTVFLHPAQRHLVERSYSGPARVSGSAGTGKTIVGLHRAVHLAHGNPDARVLLTTFSEPLANVLRTKLRRLISNQPRLAERLEVHAIRDVGLRVHQANLGKPLLVEGDKLRPMLEQAAADLGVERFSGNFLATEWLQVVDAWQLPSWEEYRDVKRLGRKTRLPESQRQELWRVFERLRAVLASDDMVTEAEVFHRVSKKLAELKNPPYDFVIVDESQDVTVPQLRFLVALAGDRPDGLFFTGDLGQRIFQQPFSWKSLGVEIRGRSHNLRVNYRTSHQIRSQADRLLGNELADVDGNTESRKGTVSAFNGPAPKVEVVDSSDDEKKLISGWLQERTNDGVEAHEIAVLVRSPDELERALAGINAAQQDHLVLDGSIQPSPGRVTVGTMHLAKGLEFRAVAVIACDDEVIPSMKRIESVADDAELEEVYNTERHLLYVACTRARDYLLVCGVDPASEFLEDLAVIV
jgi:hypothetical protein